MIFPGLLWEKVIQQGLFFMSLSLCVMKYILGDQGAQCITDENSSLTLIKGRLNSARKLLNLAITQDHVNTINNVWTENSIFCHYTSFFFVPAARVSMTPNQSCFFLSSQLRLWSQQKFFHLQEWCLCEYATSIILQLLNLSQGNIVQPKKFYLEGIMNKTLG